MLVLPSVHLLQRYFRLAGSAVFVVLTLLSLFVVYRYVFPRVAPKVTDKQVLWLTIATFILVLAVFFVVYPLANSDVPGKGSDRDEALNAATGALLSGHYPYYPKIYSGNPITPLPGSLLLAVPFVLLGNSAYQNFFWLLAFLLTMNSYLKDRRLALLLLWALLAFSPVVLHEIVTGGDLLSNSIYVLLFVMWLVTAVPRADFPQWGKFLLASLLGVGIASRINFVLVLPLVFSALVQGAGWRSATRFIAITGLTSILLTLPFYLYDPQGFSPLHTTTKLDQFDSWLPLAGLVVPIAVGIVALILSIHHTNRSLQGLARNCAIVLALPVLSATALQSIRAGYLWLSWIGLGVSFLFFGAVAFSLMTVPERPQ